MSQGVRVRFRLVPVCGEAPGLCADHVLPQTPIAETYISPRTEASLCVDGLQSHCLKSMGPSSNAECIPSPDARHTQRPAAAILLFFLSLHVHITSPIRNNLRTLSRADRIRPVSLPSANPVRDCPQRISGKMEPSMRSSSAILALRCSSSADASQSALHSLPGDTSSFVVCSFSNRILP